MGAKTNAIRALMLAASVALPWGGCYAVNGIRQHNSVDNFDYGTRFRKVDGAFDTTTVQAYKDGDRVKVTRNHLVNRREYDDVDGDGQVDEIRFFSHEPWGLAGSREYITLDRANNYADNQGAFALAQADFEAQLERFSDLRNSIE